jgi:glycosyltransferase involved in cell wall biosynthesis
MTAKTRKLPRVAYLTGQYPEVSLTFILREVDALRAIGVDVLTCSIRQTRPEQHPGPAEKEAARTTFHVLKTARSPRKFFVAQAHFLRDPKRYFGALKHAWTTRPPGFKAAIYQLIFFIEAIVLAHHLKREKVEHLHNHFVFGAATVAMLVHDLTGIPYSFTLHGPADLFEPYRWRIDEKVAHAKFVSTISHYARSQTMFFSDPAHWDKIRIIHCGVSPDLYAAPRPPNDGELRMVFVGRISPVKGLRVLLSAMPDLIADIPNLRLVLVGDGPDRVKLEEIAKPLGDHVTFTGYLSQTDVAATLQSADICVLPSFAEGVPVVLMEALASRIPAIATRVAGVSELVEDGQSGLLVAPGDVESLKAAIKTLAHDPELRARMGEIGRAKVIDNFDIQVEAARLATLFLSGPSADLRPVPYGESAHD